MLEIFIREADEGRLEVEAPGYHLEAFSSQLAATAAAIALADQLGRQLDTVALIATPASWDMPLIVRPSESTDGAGRTWRLSGDSEPLQHEAG